jgi:acetylornithine deacetylase
MTSDAELSFPSPSPSPAALALLERLVAFDTVSARSNRALIDDVAAYLAGHGVAAEVVPGAGAKADKASLWATIGPPVDGGVVLSGHSDVVPVEGQNWSSDPFRLDVRDGRAYGRGTADMKGFIACVLAAVPRLVAARLERPVTIALTFDEEVGCLGAPELIGWAAGRAPRPRIVIVGEPTSMGLVNAHKGIMACRTEIVGQEAHSSLAHLGISAVQLAARAIGLLGDIETELSARTDERFEPARSTVSVNRIGGGTALNILAGEAWFDWDLRSVPGVATGDVRRAFEERLEREVIGPARETYPQVSARTTLIADAPGLAPDPGGDAESLVTRLVGANRGRAVAYAAEAGQYAEAGYSAVIVGPGSIEQAHKADEYVELAQLAQCERFLDRLAGALSGQPV